MKPKFDNTIIKSFSIEKEFSSELNEIVKIFLQDKRESKYKKINRVFITESHEQALSLLQLQEQSVMQKLSTLYKDFEVLDTSRVLQNSQLYKIIKTNVGTIFMKCLRKKLIINFDEGI
jgi:hypothetical protein